MIRKLRDVDAHTRTQIYTQLSNSNSVCQIGLLSALDENWRRAENYNTRTAKANANLPQVIGKLDSRNVLVFVQYIINIIDLSFKLCHKKCKKYQSLILVKIHLLPRACACIY